MREPLPSPASIHSVSVADQHVEVRSELGSFFNEFMDAESRDVISGSWIYFDGELCVLVIGPVDTLAVLALRLKGVTPVMFMKL